MDQTLKLMLKCVKRLSFDRMVGRTGEDKTTAGYQGTER
jgi:hypothetical protein